LLGNGLDNAKQHKGVIMTKYTSKIGLLIVILVALSIAIGIHIDNANTDKRKLATLILIHDGEIKRLDREIILLNAKLDTIFNTRYWYTSRRVNGTVQDDNDL
jgi:hypothetical protein